MQGCENDPLFGDDVPVTAALFNLDAFSQALTAGQATESLLSLFFLCIFSSTPVNWMMATTGGGWTCSQWQNKVPWMTFWPQLNWQEQSLLQVNNNLIHSCLVFRWCVGMFLFFYLLNMGNYSALKKYLSHFWILIFFEYLSHLHISGHQQIKW